VDIARSIFRKDQRQAVFVTSPVLRASMQWRMPEASPWTGSVSYTHLTLPTSDLV